MAVIAGRHENDRSAYIYIILETDRKIYIIYIIGPKYKCNYARFHQLNIHVTGRLNLRTSSYTLCETVALFSIFQGLTQILLIKKWTHLHI